MSGSVYFMGVGDVAKVGYSGNVLTRLDQLQKRPGHLSPIGYDYSRLVLLGSFPGDRDVERSIHVMLSAHRVSGEWFLMDAAVRELIAHYLRGTPAPLIVAEWQERLAHLMSGDAVATSPLLGGLTSTLADTG